MIQTIQHGMRAIHSPAARIRVFLTAIAVTMSFLIALIISPTLIYLPATQFSYSLFWLIGPALALFFGILVWRIARARYIIVSLLIIATINFLALFYASQAVFCSRVGAFAIVQTECYYRSEPLIETRLPEQFSEEKFNSIQPGMEKEWVVQRLGLPNSHTDNLSLSYGTEGGAAWWDFAWVHYVIRLDKEGKVISKTRTVYHN